MTSNEEPNFQLPNHTSTPAQLSLQSNQINSCPKHPEKKMKFLLKNEKNQKFCSKCTLIEALKGGKVELDLSIFGINQ